MVDNSKPGIIEPGKLYRAQEARDRLRLGATSWRELRARGLPVIRQGRQFYVLGDDLLRLFSEQREGLQ
jgi:hypothetical protein